MGAQAQTLPFPTDRRDRLSGTLLVSVGIHVVLFIVVITYTLIHFHLGNNGPTWGSTDATKMGAVARLPGIPLPTPMQTTRTQVANNNTGLYKSEPEPKEEPPPDAQEIKKFKDAVKPDKVKLVNKRIKKDEDIPPPNAVPEGETGAPQINYSQAQMAVGAVGFSLGNSNSFGDRYGYYVAAMRNRISSNWLLSTISPTITSAPRTYMTFTIHRDGSVTDVQVSQSSNVPEVDRSGLRAIIASSPLPPLPNDYPGSSVDVKFYFDFHR